MSPIRDSAAPRARRDSWRYIGRARHSPGLLSGRPSLSCVALEEAEGGRPETREAEGDAPHHIARRTEVSDGVEVDDSGDLIVVIEQDVPPVIVAMRPSRLVGRDFGQLFQEIEFLPDQDCCTEIDFICATAGVGEGKQLFEMGADAVLRPQCWSRAWWQKGKGVLELRKHYTGPVRRPF